MESLYTFAFEKFRLLQLLSLHLQILLVSFLCLFIVHDAVGLRLESALAISLSSDVFPRCVDEFADVLRGQVITHQLRKRANDLRQKLVVRTQVTLLKE